MDPKELSFTPPPKEYNFRTSDRLKTINLDFQRVDPIYWLLAVLSESDTIDLYKYLSLPDLAKLRIRHGYATYNIIHTGIPDSSAVDDLSLFW